MISDGSEICLICLHKFSAVYNIGHAPFHLCKMNLLTLALENFYNTLYVVALLSPFAVYTNNSRQNTILKLCGQ
jgi:hypothetical protein